MQHLNSREVMDILKKDGWKVIKIIGSHYQFKHDTKSGKVTIPHPRKDIPTGTLKSIFKQAGLEIK